MQNLQENWLSRLGTAPVSIEVIKDALRSYSQPLFKIHRLEKEGVLIRLKRGLYCVNADSVRSLANLGAVANNLYDGASYVSMESALSHYGLIPERVMGTTSVVTGRSIRFETPLGWFSYRRIPEDLFGIGVRSVDGYLIASPEKALCDYLFTRRNLRISSPKSLAAYLEEDVRFDFDSFANPDKSVFEAYAGRGHKVALFRAVERLFA